jgi:hypothetical protein
MANRDNYQLLIDKLDGFIRKYYLNQLIRGLLYSLGVVGVLFLAVNLLEHYFYFDRTGRKLLFFSFIGVSALAFAGWVLLPLGRYFRLGQRISHDQAAQIIGRHFHNVEDKLLNILQLRRQADQHQADAALLFASINQKAEEIRPVPFPRAIDLGQNRRYLKYALPPLLVLLVLLFAAPSVIRDSTERLIHNGQDYERPAPFQFILPEQDLSVVQFEDYLLEVEVAGDALPDQVMIEVDNYTYRLTKEAPNRFSYRFNKVQEDTPFRLAAGPVTSRDYDLTVLKKPNISSFEVQLDYPAYTGRRDETLSNIGDLSVPAGTEINWVFNTQYTERIDMRFGGAGAELAEVRRFDDDLFTYEKRALRSEMYKLYVSNESLPLADSTAYNLAVVPDLYPEINVERFQDSTVRRLFYFIGEASDDYGLTNLTFNYRKGKRGGEPGELVTVPVQRPEGKQTRYDYTWDLNELQLEAGDQLTYYFEIFDNDGVSGAKSARTGVMTYNVPTKEELSQQEEANDQRIKSDLEKALRESREIQDEMKKMREKLLQEKELDWKTRKEVEKLLDRQKELQKQIESAKQAYEENLENQQDFSETEENILEKQEQLQKLFEESLSEEMQKLMQEIQEMLDQLEKDEALEMMEDMELSDEEMEKELDRMLELFKQLELEQEMQETVEQLEELAEEQEQLAEETQQAEEQQEQQSEAEQQETQEQLQQQQEAIEEKFESIQEKMEQMQEKNEALEQPMQLDDMQQEQESVKQEMQNSQQQLQQQQNKKASESMQNAGQQMKQMANQMQMQMQSQQMEQMQEDMDALRQLLENIVGLSFNQEELMEQFDETRINTPRYVELVQEQFKLKDDFTIVEDSLQALAKRVFQLESFVTEKVTDIKSNLREGLEELEERRKSQAAEQQQRAMTNLNDLALMLSETMENMQQQMSSMMSGQQMCQKPGSSGQGNQQQGPKDKMSQGQEGINEQLKKMRDRMKNGGERGTAKEFAQMAARQAALRKALEEKQKQLREQGQGSQELQELIDKMDQAEEDLVNKRLLNETMERQEDILTRLLEHEKAERERKMKEERESQTAQQRSRELPPSLQEYIKKREAEIDMFRQVSPSLKPYYKQLVDEYFQSLQGADQ